MALIRYPGSKEKLAERICARFPPEVDLPLFMGIHDWQYREPFFGAGAVGFRILAKAQGRLSPWINDIDYGLKCLWGSVKLASGEICERIRHFEPSVEKYQQYKTEDGRDDLDPVEIGFRKLALHQMSYSGLGFMSGGPIGGKSQSNDKYRIDCRWNPEYLIGNVVDLHNALQGVRITSQDFSGMIDDDPKVFLYLDPPYFKKGDELYRHSFSLQDHERLCALLKNTRSKWMLSYDDAPEIRQMYNWAIFEELITTYTIGPSLTGVRPKNHEVLIYPEHMKM